MLPKCGLGLGSRKTNSYFLRHNNAMTPRLTEKAFRLLFFAVPLLACIGSSSCERSTTPEKPAEEVIPPIESGIPFEKLGFGKLVFHRYGPPENNFSSVYVIDVNARRSWGISYGSATAPMVSPDGSKITFSKYHDMNTYWDIHMMNINGSSTQDITEIAGQDRLPTWTPDSRHVLFHVDQTLYRQSPVPSPADRQVIKTFDGTIESPFFVSNSLQLVFFFVPYSPGIQKIYTMDIDGTSLQPVGPEVPEGSEIRSPCWSPDGQKIAYLLLADQWKSIKVMVMDADGNNVRSLRSFKMTPEGGLSSFYWDSNFSICWSPDGSKLVFNKIDGSYCYHLYLINADGTGLSQVTFAEKVSD